MVCVNLLTPADGSGVEMRPQTMALNRQDEMVDE